MSDVISNLLDLLSGYGFVHFIILGVVGCLLASALSFVFNILRAMNRTGAERRALLTAALPAGLLLLLTPLVLSGGLRSIEYLLVPALLVLVIAVLMSHRKLLRLSRTDGAYEGLQHGWLDGAVIALGGLSLALLVLPRLAGLIIGA